jgi:hypothetical protein
MLSAVFGENIKSVLRDDRWTEKEIAGTLIILATEIMSTAAFKAASVDPRMKNAPPDAQLDDMLNLLREVIVKDCPIKKPKLHVVREAKP